MVKIFMKIVNTISKSASDSSNQQSLLKWKAFVTADPYSILCVYHMLFICSSEDGPLGWFCILATVKSAE